jgi:hypothetical protein
MKSKIRVEYDFDKKEPYIQFYLEKEAECEPDMRDSMLKAFVQSASNNPIIVTYPPSNQDNSVPQLRLLFSGQNIKNIDGFPRRNRLDLCLPPEISIYKAMEEVEKAGSDVRLTQAIILLQQAKDLVSDFVDTKK